MKKASLLILFLVQVLLVHAQKLTVSALTTDYNNNPVGTGNVKPAFAWKLSSSERNTLQTAYELQVAATMPDISSGKNLSWNTGRVNSGQSVHVLYNGPELKSRQRYYWRVRVWDNHGNASPWSGIKYWETGLLNPSDWSAKWIEAAEITNGAVSPAPVFFRSFNVSAPVKSARLYITAHGLYEAKLNGKNISNHLLAPGWTSYHKRLQYQTYDVTSFLKSGGNVAAVTLGDGWYRGFLEWQRKRNWYGKEAGLLYQLEITFADGKKQVIVSDEGWKSSFDGPIKTSDIYMGETFDSRLDKPVTAAVAKNWKGVRVVHTSLDNLVAQQGPPVVRHEQFKALKVIKTPKGETVIDFGQNLVGWVQVKIKGRAGDTLKIKHAEVLDKEGNFYTGNLRTAQQEDSYILDGTDQFLEPHFTFHGFRFIKITGLHGEPDKDNFTAVAIYSDMQPTGTFTSSNSLVNQLQHNIQWGQKGNFVDIPTDCPQRDERLGWTGDAQVFFNTAAYNMNVASFFTKWLQDVKADQYANGRVPVVIPATQKRGNDGSAGWADVSTIIPWNFYTVYGDKQLLEHQYSSMKAWVEYVRSISKNNLWNSGGHYGDWLFYTMADDRDGKAAITDKYLIAQTFYAASTQNLINAASVLGKNDDVATYTALLKNIKDAFNREYVTPSGRLVSGSQTAYVLALNFDMLPENLRQQAAQRLVDNIKTYKNHITTGFLGTPYICHVLTRFGYTDVAYKLLLQETYPSWLYPVKMGATTIWERWDGIKTDGTFEAESMNSFNHYSYGAIGDWMYKVITGINAAEPGYKTIRIAPQLGGNFTTAAAGLETMYGKVASAWKTEGSKITLDITVPANTTAKIVLPGAASAAVTESSVAISKVKSVKDVIKSGNDLALTAGSGTYHFEYTLSGK
ncbi:Bacterial alpha-L-rhamnosidase [Pedobacter sp. BS3]|uniref:glycoside hydrolase family 78 protein n=1 Tax=Pedobacter sp. BS3 TaxID=2567937 RepID=UPI0011EC640D|nr:glycoside hydrolase family 78 protein [Pedobacter sp. BS3]TZF82812.1 Bacterial alpha-L-rhamnosidase [Pedobacter sp. BS3]